ncbi:MAG: FAD-dependent oxidoreductase [Mycoplasmatales bacterium]
MEKIIVVGTNHAGTHAVLTLLNNYKDKVKVTTYDTNSNISFLGCGMALWIGNVIDSPEGLFYADQELLRSQGAEVYLEHQIESIDFANKTLNVRNLKTNAILTDSYDKLILACGSWPIIPPIPGIDLENIIYAKIFQNAVTAKELLADPSIKSVGVVGAGYIGVELVEAFKEAGKEAILIDTGRVLNQYYDRDFQIEMEKNMEANGIKLALNESVVEFKGTDGKLAQIVTDKGTYNVDAALLSVGFRPRTKFIADSGIEMLGNGAIVVDEHQQTSIPGVYAIGDCSTVMNNATNQTAHIALATNAVRTGIVAAHHAAGTEIAMQGVQGSNAIHIYGLTMCSTGITLEQAQQAGMNVDEVTVTELLKPTFMPENNEVTLRVVYDKETHIIVGAQMMSRDDISLANHFFSLAIQEKYPITKLALLDLFFLPHFNQPKNFITVAGLKALEKITGLKH